MNNNKKVKMYSTSKRVPEPTGEGMTSTASYSDHVKVSGDRKEAGGRRTQSHGLVFLTGLTQARTNTTLLGDKEKRLVQLISFCTAITASNFFKVTVLLVNVLMSYY